MFNIAICDNEEYFRKHIDKLVLKYLKHTGFDCRIYTFESGEKLLEVGAEISQYDMIFLEINMKEMDGLETARVIRKFTEKVYIIFITSYVKYALEGYKVNALRYLLKDDECLENEINECLEIVINKMNYGQVKYMFEFQEGKKEIILDDILYVESNLHKLVFHVLKNKKNIYLMYEKLDMIEEFLKKHGFCRVHKSYLVNLKYVENIERYKVTLSNRNTLNIAKLRYKTVKYEYSLY